MSLLLMAFLAQIVVIFVIVFILKKILDRMLIDLSINLFEYWHHGQNPLDQVTIVTHRRLKSRYKPLIEKAARKHSLDPAGIRYRVDGAIWGGMIIQADKKIIDCSLKDRLHQALPRMFPK